METPMIMVPLIGMPGMWECVLIGLAVAIFFGATKLPKLGQGLGEGILNFKKGLKGVSEGESELVSATDEVQGKS